MSWPTNPVRLAIAQERHRQAQQVRWQREEEIERARCTAVAQWIDPAARKRMSEIKLGCFKSDPTLGRRISKGLRRAWRNERTADRLATIRECAARKRA